MVSGQAVRFICGLLRGEGVSFSWNRNGSLLTSSEKVKISLDDDNSVLTIRKATVADAGEYTCVAKNFLAEARQSVILNVDGKKGCLYYGKFGALPHVIYVSFTALGAD